MNCSLFLRLLLALLATALLGQSQSIQAQSTTKKQTESAAPPSCDQQRALLLVQEQAAEAKSLDKPVAQISVMIRAAELLWPYQQEKARAIFTEAYDLAIRYFQKKGDETRAEGIGHGMSLMVEVPDQRFVVMQAIARHDAEWARRLAERAAEDARREAEKSEASPANNKVGIKLIELAVSLLTTNQNAALTLVRSSFRQPATFQLMFFLFKLAESDQGAANQLYREALIAYANRTPDDLIYLSPYPFALHREIGPGNRGSAYYNIPPHFVASAELQQMFLEALLRQAERKFKAPEESPENKYSMSEFGQLYIALSSLEPLIAQQHPAYIERISALKVIASSTISEQTQQRAASFFQERHEYDDEGAFERFTDKAEREADPGRRDYFIAQAVRSAPDTQSVERLESLAQRVSDPQARHQLLNWLYFRQTQRAVKEKLFDEAAQLADKVDALDQRASLFLEIAAAAMEKLNDRGRARESLDTVAAAALKAPNTIEKARTLLGVAHLYTKLDHLRALEVMGDAVKTINQLTDPDFSASYVHRLIAGKDFAMYASNQVPGFNLENAFRELGPYDFEGTLLQARNLQDKSLRSMAILALSARCLEKPAKPDKPIKPQPQNQTKPQKSARPNKQKDESSKEQEGNPKP